MADFDFVGPSYVAPSIYQDDQESINWYPEVGALKKPGERGVVALYPTPGLKRLAIATQAEVRGLWVRPGGDLVFAAIGNQLYFGNGVLVGGPVGTLGTSTGPVSLTDNGQNIFVADGVARYAYNWTTGVFQTLSDGAFVGATRVDFVDNYVIYNKPNSNIWGCTDISSTASGGLNFGRKDSFSDNIVSLIVDKGEVFLLGERTTEVWIDAGLFPFPFQRLQGTSMQHGCAAAASVARLGESFAFVSRDARGQAVVVLMAGYSPQRISTHAVETDINSFSTLADAIGYSYQQGGHEFYVLTFPTGDRTWVFDMSTGYWHKRAWRDPSGVLHRHRSNCQAFFQGKVIVGDYQNGQIYELSQSTFWDESPFGAGNVTLPCIRRCPHLTSDLKRQFFHELQIQFQPGVGLATGQGSDPQAMLKWSDDGGSTWGNEHWTSIGKMGKYKNRARWPRLGEARNRIFEVTVTDPVYRVVVSANLIGSAGA